MADKPQRGALFGLLKARKEEPVDEKAPVNPGLPNVVPYNASAGELYPARVKFRGLYDLDGLYKFMARWLRQRRFELHETLYKNKPPEVEMRWRAERRKTGFVMEVITVHFHMWGDYDVEAVQNGKKKKMANARMIITIGGDIIAPHPDIFGQPRWTANAIERRLLRLFTNWFIKRDLETVFWDTLYYEMWKLHGAVKDYLKMEAKGNVY